VRPGKPYPLGASFDGEGTNFSIFSEVGEEVKLCLFREDGAETCVEPKEEFLNARG
jgi:isoamylase